MSKWKCEICGIEFDNFYAQGFNNKIYCPLCFFKEENQQLKHKEENLIKYLEKQINDIRPEGTTISIEGDYDSLEEFKSAIVKCTCLMTLENILEKVKSGKYE